MKRNIIWNKLFVIATMLLFIISMIPAAIATDEKGTGAGPGEVKNPTVVATNGPYEVKPVDVKSPVLKRLCIAQCISETGKTFEECKTNICKVEYAGNRIVESKDRVKFAAQYVEAKQAYLLAKENVQENKKEIQDLRSKLVRCQTQEDMECEELKSNMKVKVQEYLTYQAGMIEESLKKVRSKTEISEDLSNEVVQEYNGELGEAIGKIQEAKKNIEQAKTKEEILESAKELKAQWRDVQEQRNVVAVGLVKAKLGNIIEKLEKLDYHFGKIVEEMKKQGLEVEEVEKLEVQFAGQVEDAKLRYQNAKELFEAKKVQESKEELKQAIGKVKEARQTLQELTRMVVYQGGDLGAGDKPSYKPGKDLGVFIWQNQNNGRWHVCNSGDLRKEDNIGSWHEFDITITTEGEFTNVETFLFEDKSRAHKDFMEYENSRIHIEAEAGPHQDCVTFESTAAEITFDVKIDGETGTEHIYLFSEKTNPTENPFSVVGQELKEYKPCTKDEDCTGDAGTCVNQACIVSITEKVVAYAGESDNTGASDESEDNE